MPGCLTGSPGMALGREALPVAGLGVGSLTLPRMGGSSQYSWAVERRGGISACKGMPTEMIQLKALNSVQPSTFPRPATRPQRREPQHKTAHPASWLCRILSWEQQMLKSGFGPRTTALYVGGLYQLLGKAFKVLSSLILFGNHSLGHLVPQEPPTPLPKAAKL